MFRFANPQYFYLLLLLPLFAGLFIFLLRDYRKRLSLFGEPSVVRSLLREAAPHKPLVKYWLTVAAIVVLIVALARPQVGSRLRQIKTKGVEIVLAVDVSNSMLAEDFEPSRLERTKMAINKLIDDLTDDNIAIVVFAGDAYVQLPMTNDYVSAKNFVSHLSPTLISSQGTSISKALRVAQRSFSSSSENRSRVIIVISDGESHDDDAAGVAEELAEKGTVIHTVGVGSPEGAPITINGEMMRDSKGDIVVTKLNEELLKNIALSTKGSYVRAAGGTMGLDKIVTQIRNMDAQELLVNRFEEYSEQYQYIIAIAILLILAEFSILDRKNRIVERMRLFHKDEKKK